MSLSLDEVHRIAHLARIEITDAEANATLGQLNGIFSLIEAMQAVDTAGVAPMHIQWHEHIRREYSGRFFNSRGDIRSMAGS